MIPHRLPTRPGLLLLVFGLSFAPAPAAAQLEFGGIPWGTPVEAVKERLQRAGHPLRGQDQDGDWVFGGPGRMDLVATFDTAGLVRVEASWMHDPASLPGRYASLADSMRRAFGAPESEMDEEEPRMVWALDGATLELFLFPRGSGMDSTVQRWHHGPGWDAEYERRELKDAVRTVYEAENGRADTASYGDWLRVYSDARDFTRVDTVRFTRHGDRLYHARFLDSWFQRRRLENGMMYNGAVTEVELDCRRMTTRLLRTIPTYSHRALPAIDGSDWLLPMPNANHARAVAAACAALGRQPD
jgi:hypothetical protein